MGVVLQLPKGKASGKQVPEHKGFARDVADPALRAALAALNDHNHYLARVARINLLEVFQRLDTLEAVVFAQSALIAELRSQLQGQPASDNFPRVDQAKP
jgi:hypothetical protein